MQQQQMVPVFSPTSFTVLRLHCLLIWHNKYVLQYKYEGIDNKTFAIKLTIPAYVYKFI